LTFDVVGNAMTASFSGTAVSSSDAVLVAAGTAGMLSVDAGTSYDNFQASVPDLQVLQGTPQSGVGMAPLTAAQLAPVVAAAEQDWQAAGLSAGQLTRLQGLQFVVTTLPVGHLGEYLPGTIYLDATADGYGWFLNPTTSPAASQVDLLTVVMHEMGHALGLPDITTPDSTDLMAQALAVGMRRFPSVADVDAAFA
jgi:hypothetical protein